MIKKILSVLLACLIVLPVALVPVFAAEAETGKTYKLTELDSSAVLQPGDVIVWEGAEVSSYLSVTYVTNPDHYSYEDNKSFEAPVSDAGAYTVSDSTLFNAPNDKFTFGGWAVEKIEVKASGVSEITLSAVWDAELFDQIGYTLGCIFKPVLKEIVNVLLDVILEIAKIFK